MTSSRRKILFRRSISCNYRYTCHQFVKKVCQLCGMVQVGMMWAPNKVSPDVDEFNITKIKEDLKRCPKCNKKFPSFEKCNEHQKREHYGVQYEYCEDCDTTFACPKAMELHAY